MPHTTVIKLSIALILYKNHDTIDIENKIADPGEILLNNFSLHQSATNLYYINGIHDHVRANQIYM